jgi:3-hydroxyisobutyrate dehydrogenase-like beta-hydroxyacid dehydrogenase
VTRDQLIPYAKEILKDAGFADYRFLPQGTGDKSNALLWQFKDGSLGSLAADVGVKAPAAQHTRDLLEATSRAGYGRNYYPAMVKIIEKG